jgi:DNA-binding NarL/FixJ family response regulator
MTTVQIVDDHALVREGLARLVESTGDLHVVGQAASLSEAMTLLDSPADVLMVDVSLPDGTGLELVRRARAEYPDLGIVVVTMHNDDDTLLEALDGGASALVLKSASSDEVIDAVRRSAIAPDAFSAVGLAAALRRRQSAPRPKLTPRETEVLVRLVDGCSVAETAKQLYMSESTVKTHIGRLYEKLGVRNRAALAMTAVRSGLLPQSLAARPSGS